MSKIVAIVLFCSSIGLWAQPVASGHWPLDGDATALIGQDAELFGTQPTTNRFGIIDEALKFNGNSDYIRLPDSTIHEKIPQTISLWIKAQGTGGLLGYQSALYPNPVTHHVPALYVGNTGNIRGKYWDGNTTAMQGTVVFDNKWHHIVLRRSSTDQDLWVDGQMVDSRNTAPFDLNMIRNYLGVCNSNNWPDSPNGYIYFEGCIDDFIVYGEALSEEDILNIYHQDLIITDEECHYCDSTNIALGHDAFKNGSGAYNTLIGNKAGQNLSGSGNVLIGYNAAHLDTASNKFVLGNNLPDALIYGDFKTKRLGFGTPFPQATLDVAQGDVLLRYGSELLISGVGGKDRFHVRNDGKVAINTSDPGDYQLSVNGEIGAKELTVEPTLWPDYVFRDDYSLMPLTQLEAFIAENQHLPDVPSTEEVLAKGQKVGATQQTLLKKIEELTLYVLKLSSENQALKQRVEDLEKK